MEQETPPPDQDGRQPPPVTSLADDVRNLVDEARDYASADLAWHRERALLAAKGARAVAPYALLAIGFVFLALMALPIGLVLSLAPVTGPWIATGIAILLMLALAALCGWLAARKLRALCHALSGPEDSDA